MAWFDGTFDYTEEMLQKEFPLSVTKNLRMSEDRKRIAIINDFEEGSELLDLSDPHADARALFCGAAFKVQRRRGHHGEP